MAVEVTLSGIVPASVPADGWIVGYRILGSGDPFTILPPFVAQPIVFSTADPAGTLYEGYIQNDCGATLSTVFFWQTPCNCIATYSPSASGEICEKAETMAPTIDGAGFCLAPSQNTAYTNHEMRIYNSGFVDADVLLPPGTTGGIIFGRSTASPQWANPTASLTIGVMNREGVWIDSDCNGTKDALGAGEQTTIAYLYNNPGPAKTIYVGLGGDNRFQLIVNGTQIVDSVDIFDDLPFKIWHIFPITVNTGANYINAVATGDGSVNDSIAMVVYDNTAAQILAANTDLDLNIPFHSGQLRGTTYSTATCPSGWSLDTSGGEGFFISRRTLTDICNPIGT